MSKQSTPRPFNLEITDEIRKAYEERDRSLDNDRDNPVRPPEFFARGVTGKYYRPVKSQISFRIDNEVLDWLKAKGEGHLTRINEILRSQIMAELRQGK